MTVYVDTSIGYAREPDGYVGHARQRAMWCHMIADTLPELHAMADLLGLRRAWFQAGASTPHYDLTPTKRALAVRLGARALTRRDFVDKLRALRTAGVVVLLLLLFPACSYPSRHPLTPFTGPVVREQCSCGVSDGSEDWPSPCGTPCQDERSSTWKSEKERLRRK